MFSFPAFLFSQNHSFHLLKMIISLILPWVAGNSNGGRFPPNQGGYRDNNFRGRGNFNEGRNYRRNDYEKQGDFSGRGRVNNWRSGEVNHKGPEEVAHQGPTNQDWMMK